MTSDASADERLRALLEAAGEPPEGVQVSVAGEQEDQQEASRFLAGAFMVAIGLMALILVTQFNSFYQAGLVLSAIVFSTAGVLLGLLANAQPLRHRDGGHGHHRPGGNRGEQQYRVDRHLQ